MAAVLLFQVSKLQGGELMLFALFFYLGGYMNKNGKSSFGKNFALVSQLPASLISPVLLCLAVSFCIKHQCNTGYWVIVVGILFGIGGMGMVYYQLCAKQNKKNSNAAPKKHNFTRHY
ncbi:MAG: AtpZ/AtpI family protein [Oscillospiraceae bacterium]